MKFEIKNRWTSNVLFTTEIDCDENASASTKLGLAAIAAVKMGANLSDADLRYAFLSKADLSGAYLPVEL